MQVRQTGFEGLVEIIPEIYSDNRGWFYEFYRREVFKNAGIEYPFVQENHSFSKKGVVRGLHFQRAPHEQAKLVSVIHGSVLDVVVDVRKGSATFGKTYYCELDGKSHKMLMVPEGFAHGFAALEDSIFVYHISSQFNRESESGIIWNDPDLNIDWPVTDPILSEKDLKLPTFSELLGKSLISR